jgi:hypothetical protein
LYRVLEETSAWTSVSRLLPSAFVILSGSVLQVGLG